MLFRISSRSNTSTASLSGTPSESNGPAFGLRVPESEALRAAQIDQIRKKGGSSHPFFWAAFELSGDWR